MNVTVYGSTPQIEFGLQKAGDLKSTASLAVCNLSSEKGAAYAKAHTKAAVPPPQGYVLEKNGGGYTLLGDETGCMYGLLDIARAEKAGMAWPEGSHAPAMEKRGIKFNIPLDARTPSYSDASDSAFHNIPHMWEMDFWRTLLDDLAENKYNAVSIWSLHPFPSLVRVPGYEKVALEDVKRTREPVTGATLAGLGMYGRRHAQSLETVKRMSVEEKIAFWRDVMQYGADRGIGFYVFTWNVFVYGTEHTDYGIDCNLKNPVTKDYFRKSVAELVRTYPLLKGIGITAGERMTVGWEPQPDLRFDVKWLADTYGEGIRDAVGESGRDFTLIHRQHMSGASEILEAFSTLPVPLDFSFKYSQAHMYSDTTPHFGDGFFPTIPEGHKTWLTVRNDDIYMMRWGGAAFARAYIQNMPFKVLRGFMMGPDGYTLGRDYLARAQEGCMPRRTVLDRQGYMMAIWGCLAYEPDLSDSYFVGILADRLALPLAEAKRVFQLCETVSMVIPLMNSMHWHDFDFQHYPEANCSVSNINHVAHMGGELTFHDVHDYIMTPAQPGCNYLGVRELCLLEYQGMQIPADKVTPDAVAKELLSRGEQAEAMLALFTQAQGELAALLADCRAFALLARFYSAKVEAALATQRAVMGRGPAMAARAVAYADLAYDCWVRYANHVAAYYVPQRLSRMDGRMVDPVALIPQAKLDAQMVYDLMAEYE